MFPVWKKVVFESLKKEEDVRRELVSKNIRFCGNADALVTELFVRSKFLFERVSFGKATVEQLGFAKGATLGRILRRIKDLGGLMCMVGDGLRLRKVYLEQPNDEILTLASPPWVIEGGKNIWCVGRDEEKDLWICATTGGSLGRTWMADREFVFRLPSLSE